MATSSMLLKMVMELEDKLSGKLGEVANSLSKVGDRAAKLAGASAKGVGALSGAIFGLAATSTDVEQVQVAFQNLTASIGETSDVMLSKLREATRGTVSDFELMQSANKLVSMGLADNSDEAARLIEMAVTLGKAMGEEAGPAIENFALMLANQSLPRLDTFGISSGKVRQRIEELQAATEGMTREEAFMIAVMEQGAVAMERVGNVWDTGATQMDSFRARMANLKDTIGVALIPVLTTLLDAITPLVQQVAGWLVPAVQQAAQWFQSLPAPAQQVIAVVMALSAAFTGASAALTVLGPMLPALGAALSALTGPIGIVVAAVAGLALAWSTNFMGIQDVTKQVWGQVQAFITTAVNAISPYVQEFIKTVRGWFDENWPRIQAVTQEVWAAIEAVIGAVSQAVSKLVLEQFGVIVSWVQSNWPLILETVTTILDGVWSIVEAIVGAVKEFWITNHENIMAVAKNIWGIIETIVSTVVENLLSVIKAVMLAINGDWEGAWEEVKDILDRTLKAAQKIVENVLDSILRVFGTTLEDVVADVTGFVGDFVSAGHALVDGLKQGIVDKARAIADAAAQVVRDAIAAAKAALGISSPSRVFAQMGEQTGEGFALGLVRIAPAVEDTARQLGEYTGRALLGGYSGIVRKGLPDTNMPMPKLGGGKEVGGTPGIGRIPDTLMPLPKLGGGKELGGGLRGIGRIPDTTMPLPSLTPPAPIGSPAGGGGRGGGGGGGGGGAVLTEIRDILIEIRDILAGKDTGLLTEAMLAEALAPVVRRALTIV